MAAQLRHLGLKIIVYLDDFLLVAPDLATARRQFALLYSELDALGLTVNKKKLSIGPTQQIKFLGLEIDSVAGELRVPADKLQAMLLELEQFKSRYGGQSTAHLKPLQALVGRLSFMACAVRNSRVYLRHMWDMIKPFQSHLSLSGGRSQNRLPDTCHSHRAGGTRHAWQHSRLIYLYKGFWDDFEWWH